MQNSTIIILKKPEFLPKQTQVITINIIEPKIIKKQSLSPDDSKKIKNSKILNSKAWKPILPKSSIQDR